MPVVDDLHSEAMDLAEDAFLAKRRGRIGEAKELFLRAYQLEQGAAELLLPAIETEPTRSVLYRSAATLAYHAGEYSVADRLISNGQIGFPPPEIQQELRELRQDVMFMIGLQSKGQELSNSHWTMTLDGEAVRHGGTHVEPFMMRVDKVTRLVYRTAERLLGEVYRTSGDVRKQIKDELGVYLNIAPGSFKVLFRLGAPSDQLFLLPELEEPKELPVSRVVNEVMACFDIMQSQPLDVLRERIQDKDYFDNFVALAKQIAPDGESIKFVGFKTNLDDGEEVVVLRKKQKDLSQEIREINRRELAGAGEIEEFRERGLLVFASTPQKQRFGTVRLIREADGQTLSIKVSVSIMKDVVQPHYEERVEVTGFTRDGTNFLEQITPLYE